MSSEWFVVQGGEERGPFTAQRLKEMAASGELRPEDKVRREDMPAARPATAVKGLFPEKRGAAPVRPRAVQPTPDAPDRKPPPDEPRGARLAPGMKLVAVVAIGACLMLCCGGFGVVGFFGSRARDSAQKEVAEADALWEKGDKAGAMVKYRERLSANAAFLKAEDKPRVYGRVIDYDVERGDEASAKSVLAEAAKNKVTPQVGHPEAKRLLGQAGHEEADTRPTTDDDTFRDRLAARFLPRVPGSVKHYEEEVYDPQTSRSLVFSDYRQKCGHDNLITEEGTMTSPGVPATNLSRKHRVRVGGGYVEVSIGASTSEWRRPIKIGALPGDEWGDGRGTGTYKLVRFERETAQGAKGPYDLVRAVIEHRGGGVNGMSTVNETILEWDGGVQSEKGYLIVNGQKKLVQHKRLISSSSE